MRGQTEVGLIVRIGMRKLGQPAKLEVARSNRAGGIGYWASVPKWLTALAATEMIGGSIPSGTIN